MDLVFRYDSPLGEIVLASDGEALTGLWFADQAHFGTTLAPDAAELDSPVFDLAKKWLDAYFGGKEPGFDVQVLAVLDALRRIPYGETRSYGEVASLIAAKTGRRVPARAVGYAVARNPVSILIPCHRVTGADGSLTGYAGGLARKRALLDLERDGISAFCTARPPCFSAK